MSKKIKPEQPTIEGIISKFTQWIRSQKVSTDKIKYEYDPAKSDVRATLYFTAAAYMKMQYLIAVFDTEAAWHGVVKRVNDGESTFVVTDILVYPQEVTGATVTTDQIKYQEWLYDLDDDVFNSLRFQGHSHVNMGVTPSPVDIDNQTSILSQIEDDMFQIFVIWNKKNDRTIKIVDKAMNTIFDTSDVDVKILAEDDRDGFYKLMSDAKEMITKKSYTWTSGWYQSKVGSYTSPTAASKNEEKKPATSTVGVSAVKAAADKVSPQKKGTRADGITRSDYAWGGGEYDMFGD